mmetsp:Transcript_15894/g.47051  ORF Transcript_15894/g.47051 Transcript_15894/m.47051 type:complete len:206 (+) Transcript_15894:96-713(+)
MWLTWSAAPALPAAVTRTLLRSCRPHLMSARLAAHVPQAAAAAPAPAVPAVQTCLPHAQAAMPTHRARSERLATSRHSWQRTRTKMAWVAGIRRTSVVAGMAAAAASGAGTTAMAVHATLEMLATLAAAVAMEAGMTEGTAARGTRQDPATPCCGNTEGARVEAARSMQYSIAAAGRFQHTTWPVRSVRLACRSCRGAKSAVGEG